MKKITMFVLTVFVLLFVAACGKKMFTVTFDTQGGSAIEAVKVEKGKLLEKPADPTREHTEGGTWNFVGWFKEAAGTTEFKFNEPITADVTVFAKWSEEVVVSFNTKTSESIASVEVIAGEALEKPADPKRDGFKFAGWFLGKPGLTWLEPQAIQFPYTVSKTVTLHAYWEPLKSDEMDWSVGETYRSTITKQARMILNPLTYDNSLEDSLIANLSSDMFSTEVDWEKAISQGVADFAGDFSKIKAGLYSAEALDYHSILVAAAEYPRNKDGDQMLDENGKYDRTAATTNTSTEWTYKFRDDIVFQDGTPVNAHTFEYTIKQYLDKQQNNSRANTMYKTDANRNGNAILNAFEYFSQSRMKLDETGAPVKDADGKVVYEPAVVTWEEVGIKVIDDHTFTVTFNEPTSQASALGLGNTDLVHPAKYAASLDSSGKSTYGTPATPYISYGPYVLKDWDEDLKLIFNKNYDYVLKGTINYKSIEYNIVASPDEALNLFKEGRTDVIGLNAVTYKEYAERDNIYKDFTGYPMFLTINTAPPRSETTWRPHPIMLDTRFRQALLYGFDRVDYNANYDIPNVPSFLPVPSNIKNYVQDDRFYAESPQYLALLEDLGVDPESFGYVPAKATALFDEAYNEWVAKGNTGPVVLKLITADSDIQKLLGLRVKAVYEDLFGSDRLTINVDHLASAQRNQVSSAWEFDMTLGGIGFGGSLGNFWQMGAISFFGGDLGGAQLGLSQPYTTDPVTGERIKAPYATQVIEMELKATFDFLSELGEEYFAANELEGYQILYDWLKEEKNEAGEVIKPEGVLRGTVETLEDWVFNEATPFDGSASERFPGGTNDAWTFATAFLKVFYEHVTHIPTGGSASATLYADKVTINWPAFTTAFGWGANRYRFLNTDPDFQ